MNTGVAPKWLAHSARTGARLWLSMALVLAWLNPARANPYLAKPGERAVTVRKVKNRVSAVGPARRVVIEFAVGDRKPLVFRHGSPSSNRRQRLKRQPGPSYEWPKAFKFYRRYR